MYIEEREEKKNFKRLPWMAVSVIEEVIRLLVADIFITVKIIPSGAPAMSTTVFDRRHKSHVLSEKWAQYLKTTQR